MTYQGSVFGPLLFIIIMKMLLPPVDRKVHPLRTRFGDEVGSRCRLGCSLSH